MFQKARAFFGRALIKWKRRRFSKMPLEKQARARVKEINRALKNATDPRQVKDLMRQRQLAERVLLKEKAKMKKK
jgi:hypothetical protein